MRKVFYAFLQFVFGLLLLLSLYVFLKTGKASNLSLVSLFLLGFFLIGQIKKPSVNLGSFNISFKSALVIFISGLFLPLIFWLRGLISNPSQDPQMFFKVYLLGLLIAFVISTVILLAKSKFNQEPHA